MGTEMLSYSQLGDRLNCSPEAARSLVKRLRLPRQKANDAKLLVSVDLSEINHKPLAARAPADLHPVIASLKGRIEVLQMELAKIEVLASGHRADFERERACRCAHGRAVEDDCRRHGCQGSGGSARRWSGPIASGTLRCPLRPRCLALQGGAPHPHLLEASRAGAPAVVEAAHRMGAQLQHSLALCFESVVRQGPRFRS